MTTTCTKWAKESSDSSITSLSQHDIDIYFLGNVANVSSDSQTSVSNDVEFGYDPDPTNKSNKIDLATVQRYAIYTVLENTVNQLAMISTILKAREHPHWYTVFRHTPIDNRFGWETKQPSLLLPEMQGLQELNDMDKMQRDLCVLQVTLRHITHEMLSAQYETLLHTVFEIETHYETEETLLEEYHERMQKLSALKRTLEHERKIASRERKAATVTVHNLDNEVHDAKLYVNLKYRTVGRWERARRSQNNQRLELDAKHITHMTHTAAQNIINEDTIHDQIKKYLDVVSENYRSGVDMWMTRYEHDSEQLDTDIIKLRSSIATQKSATEEITTIVTARQIEMDEWIADKEERRRQAELLAMLNAAATKIQALWRGYMLRHFLGPYKKLKALFSKKGGKAAAPDKSKKSKK